MRNITLTRMGGKWRDGGCARKWYVVQATKCVNDKNGGCQKQLKLTSNTDSYCAQIFFTKSTKLFRFLKTVQLSL